MPKVFIHIGFEKTATTTLQDFFHTNRENLLGENIYYPSSPGERNHIKLVVYAAPNRCVDIRTRHNLLDLDHFKYDFYNELSDELNNYSGYDVLLSNEHLSSRISTVEQAMEIKELMLKLNLDPHIILYLRPQTQMIISSYSTMIKSGSTEEFSIDTDPKRLNYYDKLELWSTAFGKDRIIVRPFEKKQWIDNNIIHDFLSTLKISNFASFKTPPHKSNNSLDRFQLKFLALFNKELPPIEQGKVNTLRGNIISLLEETSTNEAIQLSKSTVEKIEAKYKLQNEKVAREYLNRADGQLFYEEPPTSEEDKLPELDINQALAISAELWKRKQIQINQLRRNYQKSHGQY